MTLFSGDWLFNDDHASTGKKPYRIAYEGDVIAYWSGGVQWRTNHHVAQRVMDDQGDVQAGVPEADRLFWEGDTFAMESKADGERYDQRPDGDGLWQMPSWTWCTVEPEEVERIVTMNLSAQQITSTSLARSELRHLLDSCVGHIEVDERGVLQYYRDKAGERMYFDPLWNAFDHPIHDLPFEQAEAVTLAAANTITVVLALLFPKEEDA